GRALYRRFIRGRDGRRRILRRKPAAGCGAQANAPFRQTIIWRSSGRDSRVLHIRTIHRRYLPARSGTAADRARRFEPEGCVTETVAWALCPCVSDLRPMGRVERPCNRRMATYLYDNHGRTERTCRPDSHPDAGHSIKEEI